MGRERDRPNDLHRKTSRRSSLVPMGRRLSTKLDLGCSKSIAAPRQQFVIAVTSRDAILRARIMTTMAEI